MATQEYEALIEVAEKLTAVVQAGDEAVIDAAVARLDLSSVAQRLEELRHGTEEIAGKQNGLRMAVGTLATGLDDLKTDIDALKNQVRKARDDVVEAKTQIDSDAIGERAAEKLRASVVQPVEDAKAQVVERLSEVSETIHELGSWGRKMEERVDEISRVLAAHGERLEATEHYLAENERSSQELLQGAMAQTTTLDSSAKALRAFQARVEEFTENARASTTTIAEATNRGFTTLQTSIGQMHVEKRFRTLWVALGILLLLSGTAAVTSIVAIFSG